VKKKTVINLPFPELLYPYSPVAKPMPVPPVQDVCEGDRVTVTFSCTLVPYLLGLLELYRYKDSFIGTNEEKTVAVGVFAGLMRELAMSPCGCDDDKVVIKRINPETGQVEISDDGGVTWETDPQSPYVLATIYKPLSGEDGDVKRCEAANNVIEHLKDIQVDYSNKIGQINSLTDMIAAIIVTAVGMLFLPLAGAALIALLSPLIGKILETARFLMGTSQAAYDALFSEENWTITRCILYCNVSDDGSFTQVGWSKVIVEMKEQMGAGAQDAGANLASMVDVWGPVGLNNAARIGSGAEGNCDDCDCDDVWCYNFDFTVNDGEWIKETFFGDDNGVYQSTSGWAFTDHVNTNTNPDSANRLVYIDRSFDASTITKVTVTYDYIGGQYDNNGRQALSIGLNSASAIAKTRSNMVDGNGQTFTFEGEADNVTNISIYLRPSIDIASPYGYSGSCKVKSVQIEGQGTNPFGQDNCV